jgi:hypothetical protein
MDFKQAIKAYAKMMGVSESEARKDAEAIVQGYMANNGYSREFAEATFIEDTEDGAEQVEELSTKAKANGTDKVKARKPANYSLEGKPKRERKPNEEKRSLIEQIASAMESFHHMDEEEPASGVDLVEIVNPEREITFKIGENHYSLTLTCHRKPKK